MFEKDKGYNKFFYRLVLLFNIYIYIIFALFHIFLIIRDRNFIFLFFQIVDSKVTL